jgi:alpha-beta hydrolase superfamily lysophospholipase
MTDRPLFLETDVGVVGLMVSEPPESPRGAVLILHATGSRSGATSLWARTARALASRGVRALRMDYPGRGDSMLARPGAEAALSAAGVVTSWLEQDTEVSRVSLVGVCGGARIAIRLTAQRPAAGLVLVRPYLRRVPPRRGSLRSMWLWTARARRRLSPTELGRSAIDRSLLRDLRTAIRTTPTLTLVGEHDAWARDGSVIDELGGEVQVVPGMTLYGLRTQAAQRETLDRLVAWAERDVTVLPAT